MPNKLNSAYKEQFIFRFKTILELCDLEVAGFAALMNKSESHIYGILNGSRELSPSFAKQIGLALEFDSEKIFNLNSVIPKSIAGSKKMINFRRTNRENPEFFLSTKKDRSLDYFVTYELIPSNFFKEKRSLRETRDYCKQKFFKDFTSDKLSKGLKYAVLKGLLKTIKCPILKANGQTGKRIVDVFWR